MLGAAINTGKKDRMTARERAQKLVDNGVDVFILRWKKKNPFGAEMLCFEDVKLRERFDNNLMATVYEKVPEKGAITRFLPEDKDNIPVAYVPSTDRNKRQLASMLEHAPFVVAALATFGGVRNSEVAVTELRELAKSMPAAKEKKWVGRDLNGKVITKKVEEVVKLTTAEECFKAAEKAVHEAQSAFVEYFKKKHGTNNFRVIKDYKESIGKEVLEKYAALLTASNIEDTLSLLKKDEE